MLSETPSHQKKRISPELLLGISATVLSICALVVSIFQTKIARENQYASVWPHVQVNYEQKDETFTWSIINNGVGPAIVKSTFLAYKSKTYQAPYDFVLEQINGLGDKTGEKKHIGLDITEVTPGYVLKSDGKVILIKISGDTTFATEMRQLISDSLFHFRVVYSDIYEHCWQNDHDQVEELPDCQPH